MSRAWYILHTYSGYENKIERTINTYIDRGVIPQDIIFDMRTLREQEFNLVVESLKKIRS